MERITKFAKSRTEDEWRAYVRERLEDLRLLIRDNGEKAAIVGFAFGMGIILFFKLFIILAVVSVAVYSTILIIAGSE